jgi:hypothetical protein
MSTTVWTEPAASGHDGNGRDFVVVDDSGDFSYYRSEQALLASFEYVGEAACIIDRSGRAYRLALGPDRHLVLGPSHGPVEFHWLRQAWQAARRVHMDQHRLRRFYPSTTDEAVAGLFETLALERGTAQVEELWALDIEGIASRPSNLAEVDGRLSRQAGLEYTHVRDPFGHTYRPVRHRKRWSLPAAPGVILYVETPARVGAVPAGDRPA